MSVQKLRLVDTYDVIEIEVTEEGTRFAITINGQANYIDRSQADMLMLYFQEHLK